MDFRESGLHGSLGFEYVPRWIDGTETGDEDIYVDLALDWVDYADRASASLYWRGAKDVDGVSQSQGSWFRDANDTFGEGWVGELYHAYVDLEGDGPLARARLGRQFMYEGQPFHFDGAKLTSRKTRRGVRWSLFGGVPVRYFEDSTAGDWLVGAGMEARASRWCNLRALVAHVENDAGFAGIPSTTGVQDLILLSAGARLSHYGSALARYTVVDGETRDLLLRAAGSLESEGLDFSLAYYLQPERLLYLSPDLGGYFLVTGESLPHDRIDFALSKSLEARDWRIALEGGAAMRRLNDGYSEGPYNREYDFFRLGVGLDSPEPRRFRASVGQVWWNSDAGDMAGFDAEVRWRQSEGLDLRVGTSVWLYRYDLYSLAEETDVRETFLGLRWRPARKTDIDLKYSLEDNGDSHIHRLRVGCSVGF
ncbi:MAG: hypothetical protein ACYS9X_12685 [Planctomycetota bacterium]